MQPVDSLLIVPIQQCYHVTRLVPFYDVVTELSALVVSRLVKTM